MFDSKCSTSNEAVLPPLDQLGHSEPSDLKSPKLLSSTLQFKKRPTLLAAGQIPGTEGYAAAVAGGWLAGTNAALKAKELQPITLPKTTMIGSLINFITGSLINKKAFQL